MKRSRLAGSDRENRVVPNEGMKTSRERAEEKRQEKLDLVREQVRDGSLVIRQMTAEERGRYGKGPARPRAGRQSSRGGG